MADTVSKASGPGTLPVFDVEQATRDRYAEAANTFEPTLCCPGSVKNTQYFEAIPDEILQKDYGCGDPTQWAQPGDVVVDLGSGPGKACYVIAQAVGAEGRVIGVDFNEPMLALARKYQQQVADTIGFANTRFVKARIQDLKLDLEAAEAWLRSNPMKTAEDMLAFDAACARLRREAPLIESDSVDLVVSNCVLNLVAQEQKQQLFAEIFRVLKRGGRAVISDITCDEDPTPAIRNDPDLWSGCIAGAFREDVFCKMFADAGFYGVEVLARDAEPWRTIDGVEFRSMTVRAFKGKQGPCLERHQAVVYNGPWRQVCDDDGHRYPRGQRVAVCDKTFKLLTSATGPYAGQFTAIEPHVETPLDQAQPFDCRRTTLRSPRETKGRDYRATDASAEDCGPDCCC